MILPKSNCQKKFGKYPARPKGFRRSWVPIISILQEQPIHAKNFANISKSFFPLSCQKKTQQHLIDYQKAI